jgi:hypothetical protein
MPNRLVPDFPSEIPNSVTIAHTGLVQQGLCGGLAPHESYSLDNFLWRMLN